MTFLVICQYVYVHEALKYSPRWTISEVDSSLQYHCTAAKEGLNLWNASLDLILAFPDIMICTITVMIRMRVLVKKNNWYL